MTTSSLSGRSAGSAAIAFVMLASLFTGMLAHATVPQPGDIAISFDASQLYTQRQVAALTPFEFFVLSFDVPGGMEAYEFSVQLPPGVIVSGGRILPVGATDFGSGDDNWIVGTGGICSGATGAFALVTYQGVLYLSQPADDQEICLAGAVPSSFPSGLPGYLVCNSPGDLQEFGVAGTGCATLNPSQGCTSSLDQVTFAIGEGATAVGTTLSLPMQSEPRTTSNCPPKTLPLDYSVTRVELDVSWDPAIASLSDVQWVDDGLGAAQVSLTNGSGTATISVERTSPALYDGFLATDLLRLSFLAGPAEGSTPVTVDRLVVDGPIQDLGVPYLTAAGSITTMPVGVPVWSMGALKAGWEQR